MSAKKTGITRLADDNYTCLYIMLGLHMIAERNTPRLSLAFLSSLMRPEEQELDDEVFPCRLYVDSRNIYETSCVRDFSRLVSDSTDLFDKVSKKAMDRITGEQNDFAIAKHSGFVFMFRISGYENSNGSSLSEKGSSLLLPSNEIITRIVSLNITPERRIN